MLVTAFSQSDTETESISSDAGLQMEAIPALNLWDTVIDVLEPLVLGDSPALT